MKKLLTWFLLFQKRILKKPMFQATLLLIPAIIILLSIFNQGDASLAKVALYGENGKLSEAFTEQLIASNNQIIKFYTCDTKEAVKRDVIRGKAECGYIIADNFDEILTSENYDRNKKLITVINKNTSVSTNVANEIVCGKLFSQDSYKILEEFMIKEQPHRLSSKKARTELKEMFFKYREPQMMFHFEYIDGQENQLLNLDSNNNYYMMPVRGILAVLIMVAAMGGILMLARDDRKGTWQWITLQRRPLFHYFYLLMTVFSICLVSFFAIFFTGLDTGILSELVLILGYSFLIVGFCNLLRVLIKNTYALCSCIPILVLINLVMAPIFVDLRRLVPGINVIRLFVPTNYYLNAIYSSSMQLKLLLAAIFFSVVSIGIDYFNTRKI